MTAEPSIHGKEQAPAKHDEGEQGKNPREPRPFPPPRPGWTLVRGHGGGWYYRRNS